MITEGKSKFSGSEWFLSISIKAMRFELATRSVTSPDSENFAPLELQNSLTWKILALPYQKYTFSERKFHEEFKYGTQYDIGSDTKILWLKIFGFEDHKNDFLQGPYLTPPLILSVTLQHIWFLIKFLSGDI